MADALSGIRLSKHRVEAFADGVFAIVVTLLILEIHAPELPRSASNAQILEGLRVLVMPFFSYVITFVLAAAFWMLHHICFKFITHTTRALLWINVAFLMFVSALPFSTAMLGRFRLVTGVPQIVYFANIFFIGSALWLHWSYARRNGLVSAEESSPAALKQLGIRIGMLPLAALAGAITAFFLPAMSFYGFVAVVVVGRRLARRAG